MSKFGPAVVHRGCFMYVSKLVFYFVFFCLHYMYNTQAKLRQNTCLECGNSFEKRHYLEFHMRQSHGVGEPIKCRYCPKTEFSGYQGYHSHMFSCTYRHGKPVRTRKRTANKVRNVGRSRTIGPFALYELWKFENVYLFEDCM